MSEHNKEVTLGVSRAIMNGEWDKLDKLLSDDFRYSGDGFEFNKKEYTEFMQGLKSAMSNMNMEFTHVLDSGDDMVTVRFITTCRNTGKFMGAPATGKDLSISGIFFRQIKGDKVVREWQTTDLLGMMSQMGFGTLMGYAVFGVLFKPKPKKC